MNILTDKRRNQILNAAEKVFVCNGFANANTDTIARLADLGKGTIYRYYKSKKKLFIAVVDRELSELRYAMFKGVSKKTDPVDLHYSYLFIENTFLKQI